MLTLVPPRRLAATTGRSEPRLNPAPNPTVRSPMLMGRLSFLTQGTVLTLHQAGTLLLHDAGNPRSLGGQVYHEHDLTLHQEGGGTWIK
jgi:hypothetical protein